MTELLLFLLLLVKCLLAWQLGPRVLIGGWCPAVWVMPAAATVQLGMAPWGAQRNALGLQAATILGAQDFGRCRRTDSNKDHLLRKY